MYALIRCFFATAALTLGSIGCEQLGSVNKPVDPVTGLGSHLGTWWEFSMHHSGLRADIISRVKFDKSTFSIQETVRPLRSAVGDSLDIWDVFSEVRSVESIVIEFGGHWIDYPEHNILELSFSERELFYVDKDDGERYVPDSSSSNPFWDFINTENTRYLFSYALLEGNQLQLSLLSSGDYRDTPTYFSRFSNALFFPAQIQLQQ